MPLFYHHRAHSYFLRVFLMMKQIPFFFFLATVKIQNIILTKNSAMTYKQSLRSFVLSLTTAS